MRTPTTPEAELQRLHAAGARGARAVLLHKKGPVGWDDLPDLAARVAPFGWTWYRDAETLIADLADPEIWFCLTHVSLDHDLETEATGMDVVNAIPERDPGRATTPGAVIESITISVA